jgi:hypothetical protein
MFMARNWEGLMGGIMILQSLRSYIVFEKRKKLMKEARGRF